MCATLEGLELIKLQAIESNKRLVFPVIYNSLCLSRDLILNDIKTIHATLVSIEVVFYLKEKFTISFMHHCYSHKNNKRVYAIKKR